MIDLIPLKDFLASIAPVSQTNYQIRGRNGEMVFSTRGVIPEKPPVEEFQHMVSNVIEQKAFRYTSRDGCDFLCGIPIRNGQGVFGALLAFGRIPDRSTLYDAGQDAKASHTREMENFLGHLISLLEDNFNAKEEIAEMAQELDKSFEDLNLYAQIATQIKTLKFSGGMLQNLAEEIMENMHVDATFAWLPDKQQYNLQVIKPGVSDKILEKNNFFKRLVNMIPSDSPLLKQNYFIINDSRENPQYKDLYREPYRFLAVRVQHREEFYGWLGLVSFNLKEIFRQGELKLLISLAEQLAMVIANTDLYQDLEQFIISMVKSLIFAIEAKDIYTRGHSERVSNYSMLIGARLGLGDKDYNDLKWASILHDIGKIGIPGRILNKTNRLTDTEYEIIKQHPEKGCKILKPVEQLTGSMPGIIHHHERYDGRGYPQGLKGDEIPLAARIIAIADTFDAINSSRAYRGAESREKALKLIEEVAGSQLDPRLVEVFRKVYKEDLTLEKEKSHAEQSKTN